MYCTCGCSIGKHPESRGIPRSRVAAKSLQLCPTLCDPIDGSPPGSCPWDSPGKNTGVGCHFLLQCMKVKSESEVAQSCPTQSNPMDCSLPGSSIHGIFQARVLEWGAIAFSETRTQPNTKGLSKEEEPGWRKRRNSRRMGCPRNGGRQDPRRDREVTAGTPSPASAPQGQLSLCHHPQVSGPTSHIQASPLPYRVPGKTRTPWPRLWGPWGRGASRKDSR